MSFKSSVLIIDPSSSQNNLFGADVTHKLECQNSYSVIVINLKGYKGSDVLLFAQDVLVKNANCQFVLLADTTHTDILKQITNLIPVFKVLIRASDDLLERTLHEAVAESDLKLQNEHLLKLFAEQNEKLKALSQDLEVRVSKRQKYLENSKEKLIQVNKNFKTLLSALFAIQRSNTINEIEGNLQKALEVPLQLSWARITFKNQSQIEQIENLRQEQFSIFATELVSDNRIFGHVTFARPKTLPFQEDDIEFLSQLTQAISLAVDRLSQIEKIEFLKQQWETTFDAITEPVAILNADYELINYNKAFGYQSDGNVKKTKCYQALFNRTIPCENCQLGTEFELETQKTRAGLDTTFQVISQKQTQGTFVNFYHDISQEIRTQRQILESSKMAELGTIGSSIAHEINNPLAGLITFLQLIKSDLKKEDAIYVDIIEMEKAALKCKDIIQNLLRFTRKASQSEKEKLDLKAVLSSAVKIIGLKANALGIQIQEGFPEESIFIEGYANLLAQVIVNILQNSIESLSDKMKTDKNFKPTISMALSKSKSSITLDIIDNGLGFSGPAKLKAFTPFFTTKNPEKHRGLGLSVSYQIIQDHGGSIDFQKTSDQKTRARITFPSSF